mmetsp:Transcript_25039/g.60189  ORF Transcript_25039/g.60189 Transcript_25039/m.60189 type:complete len:301 (-) Transcript_25039:113-1015(-)
MRRARTGLVVVDLSDVKLEKGLVLFHVPDHVVLSPVEDLLLVLLDKKPRVASAVSVHMWTRSHDDLVEDQSPHPEPPLAEDSIHIPHVSPLRRPGHSLGHGRVLLRCSLPGKEIHCLFGILTELAVEEPRADRGPRPALPSLAVYGNHIVRPLFHKVGAPLYKLHKVRDGGGVVILHVDPYDSIIPKEPHVVLPLQAQVEYHELVLVPLVKEARDLPHRIPEMPLGAHGGDRHGNDRRRDVRDVEVEAFLHEAPSVSTSQVAEALCKLCKADESRQTQVGDCVQSRVEAREALVACADDV